MAKYRYALPQDAGGLFLSDGGMETALIFLQGLDLPQFASFVLLDSEKGRAELVKILQAIPADRTQSRHRLCARHRHLAGKPRLGQADRL